MTGDGETGGEAAMVGIPPLDADERRVVDSARALMGPLVEAFMSLPLAAVAIDDAPFWRAPER